MRSGCLARLQSAESSSGNALRSPAPDVAAQAPQHTQRSSESRAVPQLPHPRPISVGPQNRSQPTLGPRPNRSAPRQAGGGSAAGLGGHHSAMRARAAAPGPGPPAEPVRGGGPGPAGGGDVGRPLHPVRAGTPRQPPPLPPALSQCRELQFTGNFTPTRNSGANRRGAARGGVKGEGSDAHTKGSD